MPEQPIVIYDIEATNLNADFGFVLCMAYKKFNETPGVEKTKLLSIRSYAKHVKQPWEDKYLVEDIYDVLAEAGAFVAYNGVMYDRPYLNTRMALAGLPPLPPIPAIDPLYTFRYHFKLSSNRLERVQTVFPGLSANKTKLDPNIWIRAACGHVPSLKYVEDHCVKDVDSLEEVYRFARPYMRHHPYRGDIVHKDNSCNTCGSTNVEHRGYAITRSGEKPRYRCKDCGAWGAWTKARKQR